MAGGRIWDPLLGAAAMTPWPAAARELVVELQSAPGRIALVVGDDDPGPLMALADALGEEVTSVGERLTTGEAPLPPDKVVQQLLGATLLDDVDILFDPELNMDPLALVRQLSRRHPVILYWPGSVQGGEANYSEPGRKDHFRSRLVDAVILHPLARVFPDQPAYRLERIQ